MSETKTDDLMDLIVSSKAAQCAAGALVGYFAGGRSLLWAAVGGFGAVKLAEMLHKDGPGAAAALSAEEAGSKPKQLAGAQVFLKQPVFGRGR